MLLLPGGPQRPVVAVVGLVVRRLAVVVALADVGALASARGAQRGRQGGGAGNTAGPEEGAHIWRRNAHKRRSGEHEQQMSGGRCCYTHWDIS